MFTPTCAHAWYFTLGYLRVTIFSDDDDDNNIGSQDETVCKPRIQ